MNIKERLSFFQEIVQCEYPLHLWRYDPDFELLETDRPGRATAAGYYIHAWFFFSRPLPH